ncbi:MAG: ergothioneine biosynthesis protein EgtB, partial [Gemmatimonadaceae bacterium]|nr:ergothioneine biosynthesis protein EgtB [Gloeobacterales cyanobacterium ES-bin-141]
QHGETVAIVLQLQRLTQLANPVMSGPPQELMQADRYEQLAQSIFVEAGNFEQGSDSVDALDNERPAHRVHLEPYWIDLYPVTRAQYRAFMSAGGYHERCWWSEEGWSWLETQKVTQPLYWSMTEDDRLPVCGVSAYEAEAYAQFVNKRLPTEAEWEKAAAYIATKQLPKTFNHSHSQSVAVPVTSHSDAPSRNVWEWTSTWFHAYDGFTSYPYPGYSAPYFDFQHRVLKGGSWATQPWVLRSSFRNWYHPGIREIFAGFRCAQG